MPAFSRSIGYAGAALELTIRPLSPSAQVAAFLWGGGGGGGGADSQPGGAGGGGGFCETSATSVSQDQLRLFIGQGGGGGIGRRGSAAGGSAGASYVSEVVFTTRNLVGTQGLVARTLSYAWSAFMNRYAVWPASGVNPSITTSVDFPVTGNYVFRLQCDNEATMLLDNQVILSSVDFSSSAPSTRVITVTQGVHQITINAINYGGPAGVAAAVTIGDSFSGGNGGAAGFAGSSGGGGGGGGATVLLQNNSAIGVAAGGGGGGGGGRGSGGLSAPGPQGNSLAAAAYNGQDGQTHNYDGGGAGGGGGGWNGIPGQGGGGNGGRIASSQDRGGEGGTPGVSWSALDIVENPNGRNAGGLSNPNYQLGVASGGAGGQTPGWANNNGQPGGNGFATIFMNVPGIFLANDSGEWVGTKEIYAKINNQWRTVHGIYLNVQGQWINASGSESTRFYQIPGYFGVASRPADAIVPLLPPSSGEGRGESGFDGSPGTGGFGGDGFF